MLQEFALCSTVSLDHPHLPFLIRLFMAHDALVSSFRHTESLKDVELAVATSDRLMALVSGLGWTGEAILLIKEDGIENGLIKREMLEGDARCEKLWDEFTSKTASPMIKSIHRARNMFFAHWDEEIAVNFLSKHDFTKHPLAIYASDEKGTFKNSYSPWAYMAVIRDLVDPEADLEQTRQFFREAAETLGTMANILSKLAAGIMAEQGFKFVPMESRQES